MRNRARSLPLNCLIQSCEAVAAEPDTTLVSADSRTTDVLLAEEEELEKGYDSSKPSVLIIDDNEDIRSYVHTLLHTDYTVIEAGRRLRRNP